MLSYLLCIDTGFASIGWSVRSVCAKENADRVVDLGVIFTKKADKKHHVFAADDHMVRAERIVSGFTKILATYEPRAILMETYSPVRNSKTCGQLGTCYGIIAALAYEYPLAGVSPQELKLELCDKRNASKVEVQEAAMERVKLTTRATLALSKIKSTAHEHVWDSIAVGIACQRFDVVKTCRQMLRGK